MKAKMSRRSLLGGIGYAAQHCSDAFMRNVLPVFADMRVTGIA